MIGRNGRRALAAVAVGVAVWALPTAAWAEAQVTATSAAPGETTTISVGCGSDATSASVSGTSWGGPSELPLNADSTGGPGAFIGSFTVPADTAPGSYDLSATCSDGEAGLGTLVVTPSGAPQGGEGYTQNTSVALAAGAGLLAAAAGAGVFALRRRRTSP
jgi:LPXTG-motif cell wall-anchored protein